MQPDLIVPTILKNIIELLLNELFCSLINPLTIDDTLALSDFGRMSSVSTIHFEDTIIIRILRKLKNNSVVTLH